MCIYSTLIPSRHNHILACIFAHTIAFCIMIMPYLTIPLYLSKYTYYICNKYKCNSIMLYTTWVLWKDKQYIHTVPIQTLRVKDFLTKSHKLWTPKKYKINKFCASFFNGRCMSIICTCENRFKSCGLIWILHGISVVKWLLCYNIFCHF